jgi:hypothetical protein
MRKKILIKAFALLSAAVLTSCDSFLDVELNNQMTQDEVFSKRATTERYLTNVYSYLPQYYDWAYGPIGNYISMSDEGQFSWTGGLPYNYLMKGSWTPSLQNSSSYYCTWSDMYKGIKQASMFMAHADECKELTKGEIDILKAEARFLEHISISCWWKDTALFSFGVIRILTKLCMPRISTVRLFRIISTLS